MVTSVIFESACFLGNIFNCTFIKAVSVYHGYIASTTTTPFFAGSKANARVRPITPCFVAQHAAT
ncbi:uncharacterized protein METZ01_LOCUS503881 [marine metagenome]|uniref:Uncharacterized protein n=1 Tax=marine metagenome TaxID=408172 RepID=A0A383E2F4_9ZZZZ